jgi:oligoendopeptidase F
MTVLPARKDVDPATTWDIASVFPDDLAWQGELNALRKELPELTDFSGKLRSAQGIADYLERSSALQARVQRVSIYANMLFSVDSTDPQAGSRRGLAAGLSAQASSTMAFAVPELLALGEVRLRELSQELPLARYAQYLLRLIRKAEHVRSAEVEELLGAVSEPFSGASAVHGALVNGELDFGSIETPQGPAPVAQSTIGELLAHPDRQVRRSAYQRYADRHLAVQTTLATALTTGIRQDVFLARVRRYGSSLEAALSENFLPTSVFHTLVATYRRHLPLWHRYWEVRRRALQLEELCEYDVHAPLVQGPSVPYAQAVQWIAEGMAPLGDRYVQPMVRGLTSERWVDIYPNAGKRLGAFSTGNPLTKPYIFMSYQNSLFSMSTLAHEVGHSMHNYLSSAKQPLLFSRYSLFVAEVASNFNQAMVRAHLMRKNPEPSFQVALIEEAMHNFHRYFFVMPALARFELEVHERAERGQALGAADLSALTADLFAEGYGSALKADRERSGITWAEFPNHMYSNFYVFQYATGISAAHALAEGVLSGDAAAADRYIDFLSSGGSLDPLDALKLAGVDMTSPEPIERAFAGMASLVDRLAELTGAS